MFYSNFTVLCTVNIYRSDSEKHYLLLQERASENER